MAEKYRLSQDEVDHYALSSQHKYQAALEQGIFTDEYAPIECGTNKRPKILEKDEHPRPDTSLSALKSLPKVFKKDGVIHAAAASGIGDGAAPLIFCSASFAHRHSIKPLGELISHGISGCDPKLMGLGPVGPAQSQK